MKKIVNERFMSKVAMLPNGCWAWGGNLDRYGYGQFKLDGKVRRAHRVSFELFRERTPIGDLDHLCRSRACVNPLHLRETTRSENVARGNRNRFRSGSL